jgi:hypothetical protein
VKIIKESNISKIITLSTVFIITSLMLFNGYFFITKQYELLDAQIEDTRFTSARSRFDYQLYRI